VSEQYDGPRLAHEIYRLRQQVTALKAERDAAIQLAQDYAREAYEDVEGWSLYVSEHFQRKWNRDGDLAKWLARYEIDAARKVKP
jgi:hypothetical protein